MPIFKSWISKPEKCFVLHRCGKGTRNTTMSAQKKLRLQRNQYTTKPTKAEYVADLLQHRIKEESDELGVFTCFIPVGKGVDTLPSGYKRVNFNGKKKVAHKLVHTLNPQSNPTMDTSHLCGNEACCNPVHLWSEPRLYNIRRRGCIGYMLFNNVFFSTCKHEPKCKSSAEMAPVDAPDSDKQLSK